VYSAIFFQKKAHERNDLPSVIAGSIRFIISILRMDTLRKDGDEEPISRRRACSSSAASRSTSAWSHARSACSSAWRSAMAFIEHGGHISRHADLIGASALHRRPGREGLPASGRPWSSRRSSQSRSQLGYPAELALQRPATPVAPSTPLTTRRLRHPTAPRSCPPPYPPIAGTAARHCVAGRSRLHRPPAHPYPHADHARTSGL
jgi:hypothetical protein